jgi:histone H3/H4
MAEIPLAVVSRIMKVAGAERVNIEAIKIVAEKTETFGAAVAKEAVNLVKASDRKTVKAEDIKLAAEKINKR